MKEFIKNYKNYVIALALLFVFVSLSEATYSLFLKSDTTDDFNYNTGLLDLQFVEDEQISLESAFPLSDSEGVKLKPYNLTIKNTGSLIYLFSLKMLASDTANSINPEYIKVKVDNGLPHTLASTGNILASDQIIYPNEEITFKIYIWLDMDTPNNELGKKFTAKVVTSGSSVYKTSDNSGANQPKLYDNMIPVYYDDTNSTWKIADKSNMDNSAIWYNYGSNKWANSVIIKDSEKRIYDITGNNHIKADDIVVNNGNLVISDKAFDLKLSHNANVITNIIRVKFSDVKDNVYIISNDNISYYYDSNHKTFIFKNGNNTTTSDVFEITKNKWYILGYSFDGNKVNFYADGNKISSASITGGVGNGTFKLGALGDEVSKIVLGDVLFYNRVLADNEISQSYKTSMIINNNGLIAGYRNFTPMTLEEHYLASEKGTTVLNDDINSMYVWIPRFKYKVFNVLGEANTDTYDAYHKGIDVVFENYNATSGTIYCEKGKCYSGVEKTTEVTANDNGKYYTHPAFSNATSELTGLWVSKYEVSSGMQSKAGNNVLTDEYLSNYYKQIKNLDNTNDYHVIKNTEWGAVLYLTHSKYGLCSGNACTKVEANETHTSGANIKDSTTGNIYGVFDMAGSAMEYTMGNITSGDSLNLNNSHFNEVPLGTDDYDLYPTDTFILGDATKELMVDGNNWFDSSITLGVDSNWIVRNNMYGYTSSNDVKDTNISTRIVTK